MQRSDEDKVRIFTTISRIYKATQKKFDERLSKIGISYLEFLVLKATCEGPQPMVVLARRYYVTKATITSVVDELERKGLVNRRRSEEDRRTVFVELTQHGREVFRRGVELFKELSDEMLEGIDGIQEINEKLGEILKRVEET